MAKVIGPLHSSEARGSVGALTYNSWRGVSIVKGRAGPIGPATGSRLAMLQLGKAASFNWSEISPADRDAWNHYGDTHLETQWTGTPKRLSGHSWYVRCYVRATLLDQTPPSSPPAADVRTEVTFLTPGIGPGALVLEWSYMPFQPPPTHMIEFYSAHELSAGHQINFCNAVRLTYTYLTDQSIELDIPPVGYYRYWARAAGLTGLVGPWTDCSIQVV